MRSIPTDDLRHVLERSRDDFATLKGASLLVTGATGFVGSWILETAVFANSVCGTGIRLFALVPPDLDLEREAPHVARLQGVHVLRADIRELDLSTLERQGTEASALDAVVHAAISVDASTIAANPIPTLDTAVEGTRRTIELARAARASRFLFLSSGAVYGKQPPHLDRIPETYLGGPDQTDPLSAYAEGKRIGETMCACATRAYGFATVIARAFAFVGPHLPVDRHFAVGNFIRDALNGGPVVVAGDGTPLRSYLYAGDMAAWLWALLVRGEPGKAYNVGASRAVSIADLAHLVAASSDRSCPVEVRGRAVPDAVPDRYLPDVRLAKETLAVTEAVTLEDGISRTMAWHRGTP